MAVLKSGGTTPVVSELWMICVREGSRRSIHSYIRVVELDPIHTTSEVSFSATREEILRYRSELHQRTSTNLNSFESAGGDDEAASSRLSRTVEILDWKKSEKMSGSSFSVYAEGKGVWFRFCE